MYTYLDLLKAVDYLRLYGVKVGSIGYSVDGREIPYIFVGDNKKPSIIVTGGIHAREHISSYTVMRQVFFAVNNFASYKEVGGVYFVPMVNPDGNMIAFFGAKAITNVDNKIVKNICKNRDHRLYKANANGVDLNTNFDALYGMGKCNVFVPSDANYVGRHAFSEPESLALKNFTHKVKPLSTISYHALGGEIYYNFYQKPKALFRDMRIANMIGRLTGYEVVGETLGSAGGYKDYCIDKLKIPSFTIELIKGSAVHPYVDYSKAESEIISNLRVPLATLNRVTKRR